MIDSQKSL